MCKRGTSSITDYLNRFKAICELLAAIQKSLLDDDKVMYILDGLDMVFVTSVSMRVPFPPFSELRSLMMAARYKPIPASSTPLATDYVLVSQVQQTTSEIEDGAERRQGSGDILVLGAKPSDSVICQGTSLPHT